MSDTSSPTPRFLAEKLAMQPSASANPAVDEGEFREFYRKTFNDEPGKQWFDKAFADARKNAPKGEHVFDTVRREFGLNSAGRVIKDFLARERSGGSPNLRL